MGALSDSNLPITATLVQLVILLPLVCSLPSPDDQAEAVM